MSAILITPEKQDEIAAAIERARKKVIPWSRLRSHAVDSDTGTLLLSERNVLPEDEDERPASEHIMFDGGVRAAISFEEQPIGIMRHLSVSTRTGRDVLSPIMLILIAAEFGIDLPLTGHKPGRAWVEEYAPGRYAVNVVVLEVPRQEGHA